MAGGPGRAALYNRYRPRTFAEVVGQEHVTRALAAALRAGRTHHAYLFSGPRGCGKTSSARILAASLNCVQGPTDTPCGVCEHCSAIRIGSALDVVEIDAASHGLVEDTRDLRERAGYVPAAARHRVFIIDEAHMITTAGFNALLKTVEEPPPGVVFVFATTDPERVLPTIRSRTFAYQFRLVPPAVLRAHLGRVCEAEGVAVDPAVLALVARAGGGSVRDSMSILDQLLGAAGPEGPQLADAVALLGVTDATVLDDTLDALAARDAPALFTCVDRLLNQGGDPRRFATDLLERIRDLVVLHAVPDAVERGLLQEASPAALERMRSQAAALAGPGLTRAAELVNATLMDMRGTTSPRLLLELLCARLLLPEAHRSDAALAGRLDRLERRTAIPPPGASGPPAPPAVPARGAPVQPVTREPAGDPGPARERPGPAAPSGRVDPAAQLDPAAVRQSWPAVLDRLRRRSRVTHAVLDQYADLAKVQPGELTVRFALPAVARNFTGGTGPGLLAEVLAEVCGGTWRVRVEVAPVAEATPRPSAPAGAADLAAVAPETSGALADPAPTLSRSGPGGAEMRPSGEGDAVRLVREGLGATVIAEESP